VLECERNVEQSKSSKCLKSEIVIHGKARRPFTAKRMENNEGWRSEEGRRPGGEVLGACLVSR
jgi:hypothetical protein